MSNYEKFLKLVELFCILNANKTWPSFQDIGAVGIYAAALRVSPDSIPDDFERAAREFSTHMTHLGYADMLRPEWLSDAVVDYSKYRRAS